MTPHVALVGKSGFGRRLRRHGTGSEEAAGPVQPMYHAIGVRRHSSLAPKPANETFPAGAMLRGDGRNAQAVVRYKVRDSIRDRL